MNCLTFLTLSLATAAVAADSGRVPPSVHVAPGFEADDASTPSSGRRSLQDADASASDSSRSKAKVQRSLNDRPAASAARFDGKVVSHSVRTTDSAPSRRLNDTSTRPAMYQPAPEPETPAVAPKAPKPIPQSASAASNQGGWDNDCCCDDCCDGHCGHEHYCRQLRNLKRQMPQHYPYEAQPWTYYYFRPYNYRHIGYQQRDAQGWGADTRQPYARHLFDKLYVDLEPQMSAGADASSKK